MQSPQNAWRHADDAPVVEDRVVGEDLFANRAGQQDQLVDLEVGEVRAFWGRPVAAGRRAVGFTPRYRRFVITTPNLVAQEFSSLR